MGSADYASMDQVKSPNTRTIGMPKPDAKEEKEEVENKEKDLGIDFDGITFNDIFAYLLLVAGSDSEFKIK